jgi:PmbA protein
MERLLEMAKKVCEKAEIYSVEYTSNTVSFENAKLQDIDSKFQSGLSLRIIKDGKLGFAYTRNLINREELVQNALDSLKGGVEANYDFPLTRKLPKLDKYDSSLESLSSRKMVEECGRVCDILKSRTDGEIEMHSFAYIDKIRIINTEGTDISEKGTVFTMFGGASYPGSGAGIFRVFRSKKYEQMPADIVDTMIDLYKLSSKVVEPKGGKMKVMFMPNSMLTLLWRLFSGTSSKSVYEKTSPVAEKVGEKIFDKKLTIYDDPLDDKYPGARGFDDEGVACKPLTLVENGVLKTFFYDLNYASKLDTESTGHGYRTTQWGGDPITLKPIPALSHMSVKPGSKSFSGLVKSMDKGVIVEYALGAHSGNIPNGDYSVAVSPGLYVEKGEIVGRVKDGMVAGNIYETLKNVVDLSDTLYPCFSGEWMPLILCDNVSVATKK